MEPTWNLSGMSNVYRADSSSVLAQQYKTVEMRQKPANVSYFTL